MKKLLITSAVAIGLLVVWCGIYAVQRHLRTGEITSEEMAKFRRYLGLARRELAINSMEETGEMDRLSREFTALALKAKGERAEEFRAYAAYFKEFVDLNYERATTAGIMKDPAFLHLGTVQNRGHLLDKMEAIRRLQTAVTGVSNQVSRLEGLVLNVLQERGMPREEAAQATQALMDDLTNDTRFVLELCRIHNDYAQNVMDLFELLDRELGNWGPTRDGTVIFRRAEAVDAANEIGDRLDVIVEEDRALRQQNLNEVVSQLYR